MGKNRAALLLALLASVLPTDGWTQTDPDGASIESAAVMTLRARLGSNPRPIRITTDVGRIELFNARLEADSLLYSGSDPHFGVRLAQPLPLSMISEIQVRQPDLASGAMKGLFGGAALGVITTLLGEAFDIWDEYDVGNELGENVAIGAAVGLGFGVAGELIAPRWRTVYRR